MYSAPRLPWVLRPLLERVKALALLRLGTALALGLRPGKIKQTRIQTQPRDQHYAVLLARQRKADTGVGAIANEDNGPIRQPAQGVNSGQNVGDVESKILPRDHLATWLDQPFWLAISDEKDPAPPCTPGWL